MKKRALIVFGVAFILSIGIVTGHKYIFAKNDTVEIKNHTSIPLKSKKELVNDSDVIITGTAKKILDSKWSNPNFEKGKNIRNIIQTDVLIDVDEVFKGTPYDGKTIKVRLDVGKVGNTIASSNADSTFTIGEQSILFLSKDTSDVANPKESYYVLTGYYQGKFSLINKSTNKSLTSDSIKDKSKIFSSKNDKIDYLNFKDELKQINNDLKNNPIIKPNKEEIREQNEKTFGK